MSATTARSAEVTGLDIGAYTIPTDEPESDGTLEWDSTTIVVVEAHAGGETGLGYTYADVSAARFVESLLVPVISGRDATAAGACWEAMQAAIRNAGRPGLGQMAVSVSYAAVELARRSAQLPHAPLKELKSELDRPESDIFRSLWWSDEHRRAPSYSSEPRDGFRTSRDGARRAELAGLPRVIPRRARAAGLTVGGPEPMMTRSRPCSTN